MAYDYGALCGKIVEKCKTRSAFAKMIGISARSMSLKLNNKTEFSQKEINKAIDILEIPETEISHYFFTLKVQRN